MKVTKKKRLKKDWKKFEKIGNETEKILSLFGIEEDWNHWEHAT